ncbi:MAG: hypothetical protein K2I46_02875 [Clostridia bacterium]|nr:hypothetical protein [Clostridia bacterium]MDE6471560.1 hypothetical protein [Clostridia bacterium]
MRTIINLSNVVDNSGEFPVITYSNTVTTLVTDPTPIMPRIAPCSSCNSWQCRSACQSCCNCNNCCRCNQNNF